MRGTHTPTKLYRQPAHRRLWSNLTLVSKMYQDREPKVLGVVEVRRVSLLKRTSCRGDSIVRKTPSQEEPKLYWPAPHQELALKRDDIKPARIRRFRSNWRIPLA